MNLFPRMILIGHVGYDDVETERTKITLKGGAAYYSAVGASLYARGVGLVTRVGFDYPLSNLEKLKINTKGVTLIKERPSDRFACKYHTKHAYEREIIATLNVGGDINFADIPKNYLKAKFIHLSTMPPSQQLEIISSIRKKSKALTSVDTGSEFIRRHPLLLKRIFQMVDFVFIDELELKALGSFPYKNLIVKLGEKGCLAKIGERQYKIPAPPVPMVDKTGAGDLLNGVFLGSYSEGNNIAKALYEAVKIASQKVTTYGLDFLIDKKVVSLT